MPLGSSGLGFPDISGVFQLAFQLAATLVDGGLLSRNRIRNRLQLSDVPPVKRSNDVSTRERREGASVSLDLGSNRHVRCILLKW